VYQKKVDWARYLNRHSSNCPLAKMIPPWENHFGKRTDLSLIYFLNYAYLAIPPSLLFLVNTLVAKEATMNFGQARPTVIKGILKEKVLIQ